MISKDIKKSGIPQELKENRSTRWYQIDANWNWHI